MTSKLFSFNVLISNVSKSGEKNLDILYESEVTRFEKASTMLSLVSTKTLSIAVLCK